MITRRNVIHGFAAAPVVFAIDGPFSVSEAAGKTRWARLLIEAVIVGAVSGYVAGRTTLAHSVEPEWRVRDRLVAPNAFQGLEYPSYDTVGINAGRYDIFASDRQAVADANGRMHDVTALVLEVPQRSRLVGVVY